MLRMILMFIAQPVLWLWAKLQALVWQQRLPILTAIPMRQLVIMAILLLRRQRLIREKAAAVAVIPALPLARTRTRTVARKRKSWLILLPKNVQLCSSWCRMLPDCVRVRTAIRHIQSKQISSAPRLLMALKALSTQAHLRLMLKPAAKLST